ncbi:MAG: hypothetical protein Q4F17_01690 [Eubacteriales bacterium]|nr:hypothetical protein [Eubacteriales bacterium]
MSRKTNIQPNTSNLEAEDFEYKREVHKAEAIRLLKKGIVGFFIGLVFMLAVDPKEAIRDVPMTVMFGILFSGIPYGWELLGRLFGHTFAIGSLPFMLIVYVLQFLGAVLIGWLAYPFALLYNAMKAQKPGSKAKIILTAIFAVYVGFFAFLCVILVIQGTDDKPANSASQAYTAAAYIPAATTGTAREPAATLIADASHIDTSGTEFSAICDEALKSSVLKAREDAEYAELLDEPVVRAAYFVTVKEPGDAHYNFGHGTNMGNAIAVFTSYTVKLMGTENRERCQIWIFPDCSLNEAGGLSYSEEDAFRASVEGVDFEQACTWFDEEYGDMNISPLSLAD